MRPGDPGYGEARRGARPARAPVELERGRYEAFYEGVRDWARGRRAARRSIRPTACACSSCSRPRGAPPRTARCSPRRGGSWAPAAAPPRTSYPSSPHPGRRPLLPPGRDPADVAQLVEHFTRNEGVPGSSPGVGLGASPRLRRTIWVACWGQRCGLLFVVRRSPGFRQPPRPLGPNAQKWPIVSQLRIVYDEPSLVRATSCLPGPQSIKPWP